MYLGIRLDASIYLSFVSYAPPDACMYVCMYVCMISVFMPILLIYACLSQVADMHYANGASTPCEDVTESQMHTCSDLNTTVFLRRMIAAEKPDLIVFTGKACGF